MFSSFSQNEVVDADGDNSSIVKERYGVYTMRKLVSVQTVADLTPIKDADRIEKAKIMGWTVVVGKGDFTVGEKVAYFEIDSFLRGDLDVYESFMARGKRNFVVEGEELVGHVLTTAKLRGVISQGLVMPLRKLGFTPEEIENLTVGEEITDRARVAKYEPPLPVGTNIIGPFDARFAPKTDAVRLQNLTDVWDLLKAVKTAPTLKVDGTSQTLVNDAGAFRIFGRNWELAPDAAGMKVAERQGFLEGLEPGMAVQFELVGPGIQKNRLKLSTQKAVVFAVWRDGEKLPREEWPTPALEHSTPILGSEFDLSNFDTPEELIEFVNGIRGNFTKDVLDEGVVWHPVNLEEVPSELFSVLDRNANFKVVSAKWLLKHED